jgi:thioredoxin-dependent peroxiredoxin
MHVLRTEKASESAAPAHPAVDYAELARRIEDGDASWVLLNVLPRAAFEAGRIPGSVNLPIAELAERAGEVLPARDQETVVYCGSSACTLARQGAVLLRHLGYSRVREFPGGLEEWSEHGGRIERATLAGKAAAAPAAGRLSGVRRALAPLSPSSAFAWASDRSVRALLGIWLWTSILFALLYWGRADGGAGLASGAKAIGSDLAGLSTALGFSLAKAMSSDFGDVAAFGWMRLAVLAETALGLVFFSALISKILSARQEQILDEMLRLSFENRLGRVRTNLHLVLSELAEISGDCLNPAVPPRRLRARIESVAMIFAGEMQAVRDVVHGGPRNADGAALETLFACLAAGLEDLAELVTCLPSGQARSGPLRRSLRRIAQLGGDLCSTCTGWPKTPAVQSWMDRVHRLCRALCDDPRPGDPAPRFALPGSDGRTHRLADHVGQRPVVLTWFPKAFTGGCAAQLRSLRKCAGDLAGLGIACFAASLDEPKVSRAFAEWTRVGLPVLSDADGEVARAYGVFDEELGLASRWTFFIGRDGRILSIDREVSPTSHGGDLLARVQELGMAAAA